MPSHEQTNSDIIIVLVLVCKETVVIFCSGFELLSPTTLILDRLGSAGVQCVGVSGLAWRANGKVTVAFACIGRLNRLNFLPGR
jgi:hypothetical protein